ncbi:IS66 family insertion sequence element accessory protein TnpB [Pendulispora brunnea]|uniref:IS66 family insertion sequence element accessory protein TnpB n=1 Tax=Pendulispora brunnea TaxID=2905690 RepID=A0ABZ2KDS9_9BACT
MATQLISSDKTDVYIATFPVRMTSSIGELPAAMREQISRSPGALFVCVHPARDRAKAVWWDGKSHTILLKKLEKGLIKLPASLGSVSGSEEIEVGVSDKTVTLVRLDALVRPTSNAPRATLPGSAFEVALAILAGGHAPGSQTNGKGLHLLSRQR